MGETKTETNGGRLTAVTKSGTTVECASVKALDGGVLLFADEKRKRLTGFVPNEELRYVLPSDVVAASRDDERETEMATEASEATETTAEAATETAEDAATAQKPAESDSAESESTDTESTDTEPAAADGPEAVGDDAGIYAKTEVRKRSELQSLGGLGETYARRLHDDGIDTLARLGRADPERVATAADVPLGRARRWVDAASRRDADEDVEPFVEVGGPDDTEDSGAEV